MNIRARSAAARLVAVLLVSAAFPLAAADVIGKISYLEGKVEIVRDEGPLDAKLVKEGLALENFDLLKVGPDGELEVQISSPSAPPSTLRWVPARSSRSRSERSARSSRRPSTWSPAPWR